MLLINSQMNVIDIHLDLITIPFLSLGNVTIFLLIILMKL